MPGPCSHAHREAFDWVALCVAAVSVLAASSAAGLYSKHFAVLCNSLNNIATLLSMAQILRAFGLVVLVVVALARGYDDALDPDNAFCRVWAGYLQGIVCVNGLLFGLYFMQLFRVYRHSEPIARRLAWPAVAVIIVLSTIAGIVLSARYGDDGLLRHGDPECNCADLRTGGLSEESLVPVALEFGCSLFAMAVAVVVVRHYWGHGVFPLQRLVWRCAYVCLPFAMSLTALLHQTGAVPRGDHAVVGIHIACIAVSPIAWAALFYGTEVRIPAGAASGVASYREENRTPSPSRVQSVATLTHTDYTHLSPQSERWFTDDARADSALSRELSTHADPHTSGGCC